MKAIKDFVKEKPKRHSLEKMPLFDFVYYLRNHGYITQEQVDKIWGTK